MLVPGERWLVMGPVPCVVGGRNAKPEGIGDLAGRFSSSPSRERFIT